MMINVFFDTEFTHLPDFSGEPPVLISIGCVSECGKTFYAENANLQIELCSDFVHDVVLALLQGDGFSMPYAMLAKKLRTWIESFEDEVALITDSPRYDWMHIHHMFSCHGSPINLIRQPVRIDFTESFENAVKAAFALVKPPLKRHHALDDAIANRYAFNLLRNDNAKKKK